MATTKRPSLRLFSSRPAQESVPARGQRAQSTRTLGITGLGRTNPSQRGLATSTAVSGGASAPFFPDSGSAHRPAIHSSAGSVASTGSSRQGRRAASPQGTAVVSGGGVAGAGAGSVHSSSASFTTSHARHASPAGLAADRASPTGTASSGALPAPSSMAAGAPPLAARLPVPAGLPTDAAAALKQTTDTPFSRGSALLTLLPLSARSTTLRLRALTEQLLRRKAAAEERKADAVAALAASRAQAKAAGLDPSKSAAEMARELADIGRKAVEVQVQKEQALREAAAEAQQAQQAAGAAAAAAAGAGTSAAAVDAFSAANIGGLRTEVFDLRRQLAEKRATESALGRSLLRAASRHRDAKQTAAFVVAERRGAEDELNHAKTQWAQQSLAARRLFPIVVATSAKLHSIEDQLEKAGSAVGVSSAPVQAGDAPSATARSLMDVIQQVAATQAAVGPGDEGSGSGMVSTLFHALGWVSDASATGGTRQLSDDSGDLLRFLSEMDAGSSEFFSPTEAFKSSAEDGHAGAAASAASGAESAAGWTARRSGVFEKMCEQADLLIEQHELAAGPAPGPGPASVSGRSAGSRAPADDEPAGSVAAGRAAAAAVMREAGIDTAAPSSSIAAANETVAVEALAWWVLLLAAPSRLSAQLADRLPSSAMLLPGVTLASGGADAYRPGVALEAWAKAAEAASPANDGDRPSKVVTDFVSPSRSGWPLGRASWLPMPAQLRSKAAQALATGDPSPAQWYNRSASIEELEEDRAGGAPAGLLLDWMLACASARGGASAVNPYKCHFDGVAGVAALLGMPDSVDDAIPERLGGAIGSASSDADAAWALIGRHIVGKGEDGPASGPDDATAPVPAAVLAALASQFPSAFAATLLEAATRAGVAVKGRDGARAKRPGALPYGMQVQPGVSVDSAQRLSREGILANAALLAVAEHTGSGLIPALPGIVSKLLPAAPSATLPATVFADICDTANASTSHATSAASVVRAINLSRARCLKAGGGFAEDCADALPLPSSYLAPTPEAMAELRAQYSSTDSLHRAIFESLADGITRAFYGAGVDQTAVDAEAARARRMGIPLVTLRTSAPELYHLLMAMPSFTELAVSIDEAAAVITQSEAEVEAAVLHSSATAARQSIRTVIAGALDMTDADEEDDSDGGDAGAKPPPGPDAAAAAAAAGTGAGVDDDEADADEDLVGVFPPAVVPAQEPDVARPGPQRSVSNAAIKATAFAADVAAMLLRVVPALVSGAAMASREQEHARTAAVAILRPDLCRVTPDAFADFLHHTAMSNGVSSGLEDAGTAATLRSATPTSAMLEAAAAMLDKPASGWPAEPIDVVPNRYVSLLFAMMRFGGYFATIGASAFEGWSETQQARASAVKAAAAEVLAAAVGGKAAALSHPRRSDPALSFLAAGRVAQSVVAATRLQQRLAAIKAADAREQEENARVAGQVAAASDEAAGAEASRAPDPVVRRAGAVRAEGGSAGVLAPPARGGVAGSAPAATVAAGAGKPRDGPSSKSQEARRPEGGRPRGAEPLAAEEEDGLVGFLRLLGCGPRASPAAADSDGTRAPTGVEKALKATYEGGEEDPQAAGDPLDMAPGDPTPPSHRADVVSTVAVEADEIDGVIRETIAGSASLPKGGVNVPAQPATEAELSKADAEAVQAQDEATVARMRLERKRAHERVQMGKWQSSDLKADVQADRQAREALRREHEVPDHAVPFAGMRQVFAGTADESPDTDSRPDETCSVM